MFPLGKFRQERPRRVPLYYVVWALVLGETRYIMWCGLSPSEGPAILCGVGSLPRRDPLLCPAALEWNGMAATQAGRQPSPTPEIPECF